MTDLQGLDRSYRAAFLRYLPRREEAALHTAYEIGRQAVAAGVSMLELARLHHDVYLEVLIDVPPDELMHVATSASNFFLEVLSTYDMTQRALLEKS